MTGARPKLVRKQGSKQRGRRQIYTTLTNFSIKYLVICNVYTDVGGIK